MVWADSAASGVELESGPPGSLSPSRERRGALEVPVEILVASAASRLVASLPRCAHPRLSALWPAMLGHDHLWPRPPSRLCHAPAPRREEDAEKRNEAAARKAENRRLVEAEAAAVASAVSKTDARKASRVGAPAPKVTEAELVRRREEERLRLEREAEAAKKRAARTAEEEEYERVVLVANTNRDDSVIEASGVDEAIVRLSLVDSEAALPADRHPERRLKASFKAFEEAELPRLKEEKPGLTLKQYKDMIWKLWKKSPDNPLNKATE